MVCVRIEELGKQFSIIATAGVRPEAIPLKVKIVLIGSPDLYYLLSRWDTDFTRFFKVKSDFDTDMPRNVGTLKHMVGLVAVLCSQRGRPISTGRLWSCWHTPGPVAPGINAS